MISDFFITPVFVLGTGESVETPIVSQMADFTSSIALKISGEKPLGEPGIFHKDVDHLMIYDVFAHLPICDWKTLDSLMVEKRAHSYMRVIFCQEVSCQ